MSEAETFDIEELSQAISAQATALDPEEFEREASKSVSINIDTIPFATVDRAAELVDPLSRDPHPCYRDDEGRFFLYRLGVLGLGAAVEDVFRQLEERMSSTRDRAREEIGLSARYRVNLFGGKVGRKGAAAGDVANLGDRLALYRPNLLVLVNAGHVRQRFAERSPQQLAVLTRYINHGALAGSHRPYALVLVVDKLIEPQTFRTYAQACRALHTPPALLQFEVADVDRIVRYASFEARRFARDHLELRESEGEEATLDLELDEELL